MMSTLTLILLHFDVQVKRTNNIVSRTNESYDWIKSKAVAAYNYGKKERDETDCHNDTKDKVHEEEEEEVKEEDKDDDDDADASPIGTRSEKTDIPVYQYIYTTNTQLKSIIISKVNFNAIISFVGYGENNTSHSHIVNKDIFHKQQVHGY